MEASFTTTPKDHLTITWVVPYSVSKEIPPTMTDPQEGGLEIDGNPTISGIIFFPGQHDEIAYVGDQLCFGVRTYFEGEYAPSEEKCWEAILADQ